MKIFFLTLEKRTNLKFFKILKNKTRLLFLGNNYYPSHFADIFFPRFLCFFAIFSLITSQFLFTSALAADLAITTDGTTDTAVTTTASGIDQINIAAPNSSGISHNKFTDYNVNSSGQILNNFSDSSANAAVLTDLAGYVTSNPNLASSGAARIILNEVTSTNKSELLGYVEVAGTKAEVIIANPNGIICSSCGFINTSRLSLIAGQSSYDNSGNLQFSLTSANSQSTSGSSISSSRSISIGSELVPLITISGLGLDAEETTYTDIIASSIKLIGSVYGGNETEVKLQAGEGTYSYDNKTLTDSGSTNQNDSGLFAIDASSLGSIQAGKIFLIATKQGLGVNFEGDLISENELEIDANGNIYISGTSYSGGETNIINDGYDFTNDGGTIDADSLNITSSNNIYNLGDIETTNDISLTASNFITNGSSSDEFNSSYKLIAGDDLTTISSNSFNNYGIISSIDDLTITSTDSGINNYGQITGGSGTTTITTSKTSGGDFYNYLKTYDSDSSILSSKGILEINSYNFYNYSDIAAANNLTATIYGSNLTNDSGASIYSDGKTLTLDLYNNSNGSSTSSASLVNSGTISSYNSDLTNGIIDIDTDQSFTNSGKIYANYLNIDSNSSINNSGAIETSGDLTLTANYSSTIGSVSNSGTIYGGSSLSNSLKITGATSISNLGTIESKGSITLGNNSSSTTATITNGSSSENFNSSYKMIAGSDLIITSANSLNNYGIISAIDDLTLTSTNSSINNYGQITGGSGTATINTNSSNGNFNNYLETYTDSDNNSYTSKLSSENLLEINAYQIINYTDISAENGLTATTNNYFLNKSNAYVWSNGYLKLTLGAGLSNAGTISSYNGAMTIDAATNIDNSGDIYANSLSIDSKTTTSNSGNIEATNAIDINSSSFFTNSKNIYSGSLTIDAGYIRNYGDIQATSTIDLTATNTSAPSSFIINGDSSGSLAKIIAGTDLTTNSVGVFRNYYIVSSGNNLTITSSNNAIDNYGKITGGLGTTTLNAEVNITNNSNSSSASEITSAGDLILNLNSAGDSDYGNIYNYGSSSGYYGKILSANTLTINNFSWLINGSSSSGYYGLIWSGGDSSFTANSGISNNSNYGKIATNDGTITAKKTNGSTISLNTSSGLTYDTNYTSADPITDSGSSLSKSTDATENTASFTTNSGSGVYKNIFSYSSSISKNSLTNPNSPVIETNVNYTDYDTYYSLYLSDGSTDNSSTTDSSISQSSSDTYSYLANLTDYSFFPASNGFFNDRPVLDLRTTIMKSKYDNEFNKYNDDSAIVTNRIDSNTISTTAYYISDKGIEKRIFVFKASESPKALSEKINLLPILQFSVLEKEFNPIINLNKNNFIVKNDLSNLFVITSPTFNFTLFKIDSTNNSDSNFYENLKLLQLSRLR